MINLAATRAVLADVLADVTQLRHVYPRAVTGTLVLPCAVIGVPDIEWHTGPCMDTTTLPIAVLVGRDGTDDAATQAELEELMLAVAARLTVATDDELLQVCSVAKLTRADFEPVTGQGSAYPAYTFELELHG